VRSRRDSRTGRVTAVVTRKPNITPGGPLGRLVVGFFMRWLRWLSPATRRDLAFFVASVAFGLGIHRTVALDNLKHAFPEKSEAERLQIARGVFRSLALAAIEAVTSDLLPDDELKRTVEVVDWKGLDVVLDAHQPVLLASAHLGSWELFAEVMARRQIALSAVVRPLAGAFNEWVVNNRKGAGVEDVGGARARPCGGAVDRSGAACERRGLCSLLWPAREHHACGVDGGAGVEGSCLRRRGGPRRRAPAHVRRGSCALRRHGRS
jgi:hypothetical protein